MQRLPRWALPPTMPSVYDVESVTSLEGVARLHGAINQLIDEFNELVKDMETSMGDFTGSSSAEIQDFKAAMELRLLCKFQDLEAKLAAIKTDLSSYTTSWLESNVPGSLPVVTAADEGKLMMVHGGKWQPVTPAFTYDQDTETLTLNMLGG